MGFDDLAKHMAKRDGKKAPTTLPDLDKLAADGAKALPVRRISSRTRDLITGSLLFLGGGFLFVLYALHLADALPQPDPPQEHWIIYSRGLSLVTSGAMVLGLVFLSRGLRRR
jgi:hypothetical protein